MTFTEMKNKFLNFLQKKVGPTGINTYVFRNNFEQIFLENWSDDEKYEIINRYGSAINSYIKAYKNPDLTCPSSKKGRSYIVFIFPCFKCTSAEIKIKCFVTPDSEFEPSPNVLL